MSRVLRAASALFLLASPATAQQFGQWWWTGHLGLGYKSFENEVQDALVTDYQQQELELGVDVNGYVIHPAVGSFDLGLNFIVSELDGTQTIDTDRYGAHGTLKLFERGKYPLRFFITRESFDYSDLPTEDAFTLLGAPETLTRWGGRARLRAGPLRGSLLGFEHTAYDLLESVQGTDVDDTQFYDWSRTFGDVRHRVRVERRERRLGVANVSYEDYILNLEEGGNLGEAWRWDLNGNGVRRNLEIQDGSQRTFETYFIRNRLLRTVRDRDLLDVRNSHGLTTSGDVSDDRHTLSVFYRWRPRPNWEIGPFTEYSLRSTGDVETTTPRAGLVISWNRTWKDLTAFLSTQGSYASVSRSGGDFAGADESRVAYSFSGNVTHRATERFMEEVEAEVTRNELRLSPGTLLELPDLGVGLTGLGTESKDRLRLTLEQRWRLRMVRVYGEWTSRSSDDVLGSSAFDLESVSGNLTLSGRRWSLQGHMGDTEITREGTAPENLEFLSASASLRPFRFLSLRGSYRKDTRSFELLPSIDAEQKEIYAVVRIGEIALEARAFEYFQESMELTGRTTRGLVVSMSRRFGGLLPVVTGSGRRGSIR